MSGTWRDLTQNVNQLAGNLTTQVRAIAEVSSAVTQGDLTRQITVEALGEVAELKDTINQMIANLRDTTQQNAEQDWLKTNLARISGLMQGQRDLATVSRLIMSEISPLVTAQHGAFFLLEHRGRRGRRRAAPHRQLRLQEAQDDREPLQARRGARRPGGARGQEDPHHPGARRTTSGSRPASARRAPVNIVVMPILFEEQVLAVVELASLHDVLRRQPGVPRAARRDDRRRAQRDHRQPPHGGAAGAVPVAHRGAAVAVRGAPDPAGGAPALQRRARGPGAVAAGLRGAAADPAGGAAADQRGAAGEGAAPVAAEPRHRAQERRDRAGAQGARGERRAARAELEVQVGVPGEHEPRAAHAAQLAADPLQAALRQPRGRTSPTSRSSSPRRSTRRATTC